MSDALVAADNQVLYGEFDAAEENNHPQASPQTFPEFLREQFDLLRESRIAKIQEIEPNQLAGFREGTLVNLSLYRDPKNPAQSEQTLEEIKTSLKAQYSDNESEMFSDLLRIVANPDLVEIFTASKSVLEDKIQSVDKWRKNETTRLSHLRLSKEADLMDRMTLQMVYEEMSVRGIRVEGARGSMDTASHIIENCTRVLMDLSRNDLVLRVQAMDAISSALRQQSKWWTCSLGMEDGLTRNILDEVKKVDPASSVKLAMDLYLDKMGEDRAFFEALLNNNEPMRRQLNFGLVFAFLDGFEQRTYNVDLDQVRKSLSSWVRSERVMPEILSKVMSDRRLFGFEVDFDPEGSEFRYFGHDFHALDLPDDPDLVFRAISYNVVAVEDSGGNALQFYNIYPSDFYNPGSTDLLPNSIEGQLIWRLDPEKGIDEETAQRFYKALPEVFTKLDEVSHDQMISAGIPMPFVFQYWLYMDRADTAQREQMTRFIKEYEATGLLSLLTGEYSRDNIDQLLKFTQPDQNREDEWVQRDLAEFSLNTFAQLGGDAWRFAVQISANSSEAHNVFNIILARAKALMTSCINYTNAKHDRGEELTDKEAEYFKMSFAFQTLYMVAMGDESGRAAGAMDINFEAVREFFHFHDPTDPDSVALYRSVFDAYFESFCQKQGISAEYAGEIEKINSVFYPQYAKFESDISKVTPDLTLEKARCFSFIDREIENGDLPLHPESEHPVVIGFVGYGNGRIEKEIIRYLRDVKGVTNYKFIALDVVKPEIMPTEVDEYHIMSVTELGQEFQDHFTHIWAMASPLMDVVMLEEWIDVASSVAGALVKPGKGKRGGRFITDMSLMYGKHSYQKAQQAYHRLHPDEPENVFYRTWPGRQEDGGNGPGKWFFGPEMEFFAGIFGECGLEWVNVVKDPKELRRQLEAIEADDKVIVNKKQADMMQQPWYQSHSLEPHDSEAYRHNRWNRMTVVMERVGELTPDMLLHLIGRRRRQNRG